MNSLQTLLLLFAFALLRDDYHLSTHFFEHPLSGLTEVWNNTLKSNESWSSSAPPFAPVAVGACTGVSGPNLIFNGDFGSGPANILPSNPGYAPSPYTYTANPPPDDGAYTVTNNTTNWGSFAANTWINIKDNSPDPSGYMMVVNGSVVPGTFYENAVSVCENLTYEFSCDVISLNKPADATNLSKPNISFLVNGIKMHDSGNVPIDSAWHTYSFTFQAPPGTTSLAISLVNNTPGGQASIGNDFAIDNVVVRTCGPSITLVETTKPPYCQGDFANAEINIGPGFDSTVWQWQFSADGGVSWLNIGLVQTMPAQPLFMGGLQINILVRAIVAETNTGLTSPGCHFFSDTLAIPVYPHENVFLSKTICNGEVFSVGDSVFTKPGNYTIPLTSSAGCDSIVTLVLAVNDTFLAESNAILCAGQFFKGVPVFSDTTFIEKLPTWQGCDSTFLTHVEVLDSFLVKQNFTVCRGETVNGISIWSDTTMINHWQTWQGCDSLYVWNVTVVDSVMSYRNANLCRGDFFHGMPMFSDAVVVENDKTYFGCDSTIIWTISVSDSVLLQQNLLLCEGDAFNGVAIYSDTTWMELLQTQQGCDSTVMTYIAILPVQTTTQTLDACYGDLFNGISLTVDTVITIQHTGFNGCDSNTVYQVRVKAPLNLRIEGGTSLCGDGITTLSAGNFSAYQWSNGETAPSISVTSPGEYAVTVTASTGCTASAGVQVTGRLSASSDFDDPLCFGDSNGRIEVIITEGTPPFKFSLNGKEQASPVFNDLAAGIYQLVVSDAGGCVDEDTLELIAPDLLLLQPGDNPKINLGDSVQLNPYTNANSATWRWDPPAGLSCADCPFPIASPLETTVYTLEVVNQNQCSISANLTVTVNKNRQIYVPTAFSPNDDGVNDFFTVYSGKGVTFIRRFEVYDRWGGLVFTAPANSPSGEETLHWDGTLKGKNLQPAVFTWLIVIELADGTQEKYEGSVTLMR